MRAFGRAFHFRAWHGLTLVGCDVLKNRADDAPKGLHIPPAIDSQVDVGACIDGSINRAIGFEEDLAVALEAKCLEFLRK